jgi:CYTH domain-containing protein
MRLETERKFLVTGDGWRDVVVSTAEIFDGLVMRTAATKLRVRKVGDKATLTFKGPRTGITRREFEYEIPASDADLLLAEHCESRLAAKLRHCIVHKERTWLVDEYLGLMSGIVIAEIELIRPDEQFDLPAWAGREVTHDPAFRKGALHAQAQRRVPQKISNGIGRRLPI